MKRMVVFVCLLVLLLVVKPPILRNDKIFKNADRVVIVSSEKLTDDYLKSGQDYYTYFDSTDDKRLYSLLTENGNIKGFNLYFSSEFDFSYFQHLFDYISAETIVENCHVYHGFCREFQNFNWVDGKKYNVQLAKTEDGWVLGFPLILTGF